MPIEHVRPNMTDEERQKLVERLRLLPRQDFINAANEIERLTHALIQLQQRFDSCQNQLRQTLEANDFLTKEARDAQWHEDEVTK